MSNPTEGAPDVMPGTEPDEIIIRLSGIERDTIIAALRMYQKHGVDEDIENELCCDFMDDDDVDELCERINLGEA